jgi:outer membrane protein assembly factor BamD (BamD/ComL family)
MDAVQAEKLYEHGTKCYNCYDYDGAIKAFKELLKIAPNYRGGHTSAERNLRNEAKRRKG